MFKGSFENFDQILQEILKLLLTKSSQDGSFRKLWNYNLQKGSYFKTHTRYDGVKDE